MSAPPDCRSCGAPLRHTFVDLGEQPLSNGFPTREQHCRFVVPVPHLEVFP